MSNITEELNKIKHAVYGREVRQAIHDAIEKAYNDATSGGAGDTNLEVVLARGSYDALNKRLNASDLKLAETATKAEVNKKSVKEYVDNTKRDKAVPIGLNDVDSELLAAIAGGEGTSFNLLSVPRDKSVTPIKTDFLKLDTSLSLYDGNYFKMTLTGNAEGGFTPNDSETGRTAKIIIEPNTTYSVIRESSSAFKIGTDTIFDRESGRLDGDVRIHHPNGALPNYASFTTGKNDVVLYVQYTSDNEDILVQIVEGEQTELTINEYPPYIPNEKLSVYTKKEIDSRKIKPSETTFLERANLYDGKFIRKTLFGSRDEPQTLTDDEQARTAKVIIKPNTTYSVIREPSSRFKIASDTIINRQSGHLDGAVNIFNVGSSSVYHETFTTGPNDAVLYVYYSNSDEHTYIEIVEGVQTNQKHDRYGLYYLSKDIIPTRDPEKVLKVLFISNSFGNDSIQWVSQIAKSVGINVTIANAHLSGASLETNYENAVNNNPVYTYNKFVVGYKTSTTDNTILEILQDETWDIVVFQQSSSLSHDYSSYEPYLSDLLSWTKSNANNTDVQFGLNMVWSYADDFSDNFTSEKQWKDNVIAYKEAMKENNIHYLIPSGTAIQNGRTSDSLNDIGNELTRDGAHLDYGVGRYIVGLTVFYTLIGSKFNKLIDGVSFIPSNNDDPGVIDGTNINNYLVFLAKLSAKSAIDKPFELSDI